MTADTDRSRLAYTEFIKMSADGTLPSLDETSISEIASAMSDSPSIQQAAVGTYYSSLSSAELDAEEREREMSWNRLRQSRRDAMFRSADVSPEEAGRLAFDEMAGDPSGMLKAKERFFFR